MSKYFVTPLEKDGQKGQGLVEYALILVLVSIAVIGTLSVLGTQVGDVFNTISTTLAGADAGEDTSACNADPTACGFVACAIDGGFCNATGTNLVMYGANETYANLTMTGAFTCLPQNDTPTPGYLPLYDPVPGVTKTCFVKPA